MLLIMSLNTAAVSHIPLCCQNPDPIHASDSSQKKILYSQLLFTPPQTTKMLLLFRTPFSKLLHVCFSHNMSYTVPHSYKITGTIIILGPHFTFADPGGHVVQDVGLRPLDCWDHGFRSG